MEDETTTDTTVSIEDLTPYTDYTCTIPANTDAGIEVNATIIYRALARGSIRFHVYLF